MDRGQRFPHEPAIADLQRAVSINPNLAQAYIELEKVYYHIGLTDKAVEANQRAQGLDPAQARSSNRAFRALVDAGKLEDVRFELESKRNLGAYARAEALVAMGKLHEALQLLSKSRTTVSTDSEYDVGALALMGVVYARLGQREDAERVIATVMPTAENQTALSHVHHAQFNIGATLAWLDRPDEAVQWLTKAAFQGYPSYPKFSTDQSLVPLKRHPDFGSLLARLRKDWDRWQKTL
jgi:tetratricopeptide (TPR) repeat protein